MTEEVVIAGFGGQGVLSMGLILSYSGMMEDKEISKIVEDRLSKPYNTISHEDMLKSLNIDANELKE